MVAGVRKAFDLTVHLIHQSTVKALGPNTPPTILPVSNLDRIVGGFPVLLFYTYRRPPTNGDFPSVVSYIKTSLSDALGHFSPFAAQIMRSPETGESEVLCNNEGARIIEASANISLSDIDFYNQNKTIRKIFLPENISPASPLSVQVTSYTCGGFSISWTFNHLLSDAYGFVKFLTAWCEIARTKKLTSGTLNSDRQIFRPRTPPSYSQLVDKIFTVCTFDEMIQKIPARATERHLYFVKGSTLERIRTLASERGPKRTRTEALSAYMWKLMADTVDTSDANVSMCKMGFAVDGRRMFDPNLSNFVGNVVSMAVGEEIIEALKEGSLADVAGIVFRSIHEVANRAHFLDLIDWIECHRSSSGKIMLPSIVLGHNVPAIIVSSCHKMPVMSMDFGVGLPAVGMFISAIDQMGTGNVRIVSSGRGDGSWFVSALIWPELARALESDPEHVFEPITADHLCL